MKLFWCISIPVAAALCLSGSPQSSVATEAHRFLALLPEEQRGKALQPFDSQTRQNWHYVPRVRSGLAWRDLTADQRVAAHDLLKSSLSKTGYQKIEELRALEPVLRQMEGGNPDRDPDKYHFVFFGEPADQGRWAWRYEGHHISLTFAFQDGRLVASTPQFLGSNPAMVPSGPKQGQRVLAKEQDLAFGFLSGLSPDQLSKARIGAMAPSDILTTNARRASIEGRRGIPYRDLSPAQQQKLLGLLRVHAEVQTEKEQARRLEMIQKEDPSKLVFAWMGPFERRSRHYYRIQGEGLIVEYDNTQGDGNHVHTVWRNLKEDFGDPLGEHYAHGHSHR